MSGYPVVLDGRSLTALVVGGGRVAARRVFGLLDAGATVRVVARHLSLEIASRAVSEPSLEVIEESYSARRLDGVSLVIAATDDAAVNARVAEDAKALGKLVCVADQPDAGNFVTPAVHRAGEVLVAVTTGGVPAAAARLRDAIAQTVDAPVAAAVNELANLRRRLIDRGDRERWQRASATLIGDDFLSSVRGGSFAEKVAEWR